MKEEEKRINEKYNIGRESYNLNKNVRKLNEEQKIYIIEKDMKKFNEIDNKIKEKKDKIFRLNAETKSIENQQKEILKESIKDLKKKIGLLEVEYEVVKKYNNTYRMNEIKLEIMNKNYKIQTVQMIAIPFGISNARPAHAAARGPNAIVLTVIEGPN